MAFLALNLLDAGVQLSMLCAIVGLLFAFLLIAIVIRASAGNERMRQISAAVQEGARAYLNRQVVTVSAIAVIIFILLFFFKDHPTAIGFVIGAFCSLSAGFIGMRVAVVANVRRLCVNSATKSREDADQARAEGEPDKAADRHVLADNSGGKHVKDRHRQ